MKKARIIPFLNALVIGGLILGPVAPAAAANNRSKTASTATKSKEVPAQAVLLERKVNTAIAMLGTFARKHGDLAWGPDTELIDRVVNVLGYIEADLQGVKTGAELQNAKDELAELEAGLEELSSVAPKAGDENDGMVYLWISVTILVISTLTCTNCLW